MGEPTPLLKVEDLRLSFQTYVGRLSALRGINFSVYRKETVAIVGESGSGKSVLAQAIMRLIVSPPGVIESGKIYLDGEELLKKSEREMRKIRGSEIGIIFQDPMTSLNPTMRIGKQITEGIVRQQNLSREEAEKRAIEMLNLVGISDPEKRVLQYPHQFSGGMRQRVMIAIALAAKPKLLIADEPTTALDVTVQAQILDLMREIQKKIEMSIIFITHDLGIVANICDRVMVMYAGELVEQGDVLTIFQQPQHPYTKGLLRSCPRLDMDQGKRLIPIEGAPPTLFRPPKGCSFCPRCEDAMHICQVEAPKTSIISKGHSVRCWKCAL